MNSSRKGNLKTFMVRHFRDTRHDPENISIDILDYVENEENAKKYLRDKELQWIQYIITAHPFGFSDKIKGFGISQMIQIR